MPTAIYNYKTLLEDFHGVASVEGAFDAEIPLELQGCPAMQGVAR